MKSALRYLSLALASSALLLGPGQAIAGGGDWGGGRGPGSRIRDVDVCFDSYDNDLRVRFKATGPRRYGFTVDAFLSGNASCNGNDSWGHSSNYYEAFDNICTDPDTAYRVWGNRYEASLGLFDIAGYDNNYDYCGSRNGDFESFDWDGINVRIDGRQFYFDQNEIDDCDADWWDDSWN